MITAPDPSVQKNLFEGAAAKDRLFCALKKTQHQIASDPNDTDLRVSFSVFEVWIVVSGVRSPRLDLGEARGEGTPLTTIPLTRRILT